MQFFYLLFWEEDSANHKSLLKQSPKALNLNIKQYKRAWGVVGIFACLFLEFFFEHIIDKKTVKLTEIKVTFFNINCCKIF